MSKLSTMCCMISMTLSCPDYNCGTLFNIKLSRPSLLFKTLDGSNEILAATRNQMLNSEIKIFRGFYFRSHVIIDVLLCGPLSGQDYAIA